MKAFVLTLFVLNLNLYADNIIPKKKFVSVLNDNLNSKPLEKKGYIVQKRRVANNELTSYEEEEILISIGLGEYTEDLDSLDRKILLYRLRNYTPKLLYEYYPDISKKSLMNALEKLR